MVVISQKVGTLCIDYRPPETVANLCFDDGIFEADDCDQFFVTSNFEARFVQLLPVFNLDSRCYTRMRVKVFSIFDAIDFVNHLSIEEFEIKFVENKFNTATNSAVERDVVRVEFSGNIRNQWAMKIFIAEKEYFIFRSNYLESAYGISDFQVIYQKA